MTTTPASVFDRFDETAEILARARQLAEGDALASVLASPKLSMPIAEARGVDARHFAEPDHFCIWSALIVGRDHDADQLTVLRYAEFLLRHERMWCDAEPARCWRQGRHSHKTLARMALLFPFDPGEVARRADRLTAIVDHCDAFGRMLRDASTYHEQIITWLSHDMPGALAPEKFPGEELDQLITEHAAARQTGQAA